MEYLSTSESPPLNDNCVIVHDSRPHHAMCCHWPAHNAPRRPDFRRLDGALAWPTGGSRSEENDRRTSTNLSELYRSLSACSQVKPSNSDVERTQLPMSSTRCPSEDGSQPMHSRVADYIPFGWCPRATLIVCVQNFVANGLRLTKL